MRENLRELWRYRELLFSMVQRELKIRYKGSVIGFFWSLINPAVTVVVLTVVFKYLMRNNIPSFSAYLLAAMLPYFFVQQALLDSAQSISSNIGIVRKVYFPREIFPISIILSNFIHLVFAMLVFVVFLLVSWAIHPGANPIQPAIVLMPVLLLINLALVMGLGLWFSALSVFVEDVKYLLSIGLYLLFYMCPIIYFSEILTALPIPHQYQRVAYLAYHLNPFAMLATAYRKTMLAPIDIRVGSQTVPSSALDWRLVGVTAVIAILCLFFGYAKFNKLKWKFVEKKR